MTFSSETFLRAIHFAARAHGDQKMLSGLPYVVHLSCVTMEVVCALRAEAHHDEDLAILCAVLHDVVEDTPTSLEQVGDAFGLRVASGVGALTKDAALAPEIQMRDSLARILQQPSEIAIVKLADRLTNTASPPPQWTPDQIDAYREEAKVILDTLGHASAFLAERLRRRIAEFRPTPLGSG